MSATGFQRGFGYGCRETPDITNKFLEQLGFYRKHVATDSSSLFRVVSELRYDIQLYHHRVRLECVKYMRKNRGIFTKEITYAYDSYLNNLCRSRTYGSLLELKAMALRYRVNILLFEPLTEGNWYVYNPRYKTTWRIYLGRDNHFDVIYPLEEMKVTAECQAIVYKILYVNVFALPDVDYAVERMLHDREDRNFRYETDEEGTTTAITPDGLRMQLYKEPANTQCALIYSHLCHFHNPLNFAYIEDFFSKQGLDEGCRVYVGDFFQHRPRKPNPLLTDRYRSCVRQLLELGITPFPYKAAKSLDPCIYRNVEFDVWQEARLERINHILEYEKRVQNEKNAKRKKLVNPLALTNDETPESPRLIAHYNSPEQTDGMAAALEPVQQVDLYGRVDTPMQLTTYQGIYMPEQYAVNAVGIVSPEPNHLTFADNGSYQIGVQNCLYNPFATSTPVPIFHTTPTQSPLKHIQQPPIVPANVVSDQLTLLPHHVTQPLPNEYVMLVDTALQPQQQQQQLYQAPQQQQQQHYNQQQQQQQQHYNQQQHQRQRHRRHHRQQQYQSKQQQQQQHELQQQEQQRQRSVMPRCLLHCYPSGEDMKNRTLSLTYDNTSYTPPQTQSVFHVNFPFN